MKKESSLINVINVVLSIIIVVTLFFITIFSIGSKEHHEDIIKNSRTSFILSKLFINSLFIVLCMLILLIINLILKKIFNTKNYKIGKTLILETFIYLIFALIFILISI